MSDLRSILKEEYTNGVIDGVVINYFKNGNKLQIENYVLGIFIDDGESLDDGLDEWEN